MRSVQKPAVTLSRAFSLTYASALKIRAQDVKEISNHSSRHKTSATENYLNRRNRQVSANLSECENLATTEFDSREASRLQDVTKRLLCPTLFPVGSYHSQAWAHAEKSIHAWTSIKERNQQFFPQANNITKALELFERLIQEAHSKNSTRLSPDSKHFPPSSSPFQRQSKINNIVKVTLLNNLLQNWSDRRKQLAGHPSVPSLAYIWHKVQHFQSLGPSIRLDTTTYKILLASFVVVSRQGGDTPDLAEAILWNWIDERQRPDNHQLASPDMKSIRVAMNGWKKSRRLKVLQRLLSQALVRNNAISHDAAEHDDYQKLLVSCSRQDGDGFDKAESLLNFMMENEIPTLGTSSLNAALTALVNQHNFMEDSSSARAIALLNRVMSFGIFPDRQTFDVLIQLGSKRPHGSHNHLLEMQAVFDEWLALLKRGYVLHFDLVQIHQTLLQEWANAGEPLQAKTLLERIFQDDAKVDAKEAKKNSPNWTSVAIVLEAWLHSERLDAPERAHALVDRVMATTTSSNYRSKPTAPIYAQLISIWRHSRRSDRAEQAQTVFDEMAPQPQPPQRHGIPKTLLLPNETHFIPLAQVWAEVGNVEKAESVLLAMSRTLYANAPNAQVTTALIDVWTLAGQVNAAEKSERIVQGMLRQHDRHVAATYLSNFQPTSELFCQLMQAWKQAHSRRDRGEKAQACFDDMCSRYLRGDSKLRPSLATYNALLSAWASVGNIDQVRTLIEEMTTKYGIEPDFSSLAALMDACSISQRHGAVEQVQSLFEESMETFLKRSGNHELPASAKQAYLSMMNTWAKSGSGEAGAIQVQTLLDDMSCAHSKRGNLNLRPQSRHCAVAIKAWANAKRPDKAETLRRHVMETENMALDSSVFACTLDAWLKKPGGVGAAEAFFAWAVSLGPHHHHFLTDSDGNKVVLAWSQHKDSTSAQVIDRTLSFVTSVLKPHNLQPTADAYKTALSMILKSRLADKRQRVERLVHHMASRGIQPNSS